MYVGTVDSETIVKELGQHQTQNAGEGVAFTRGFRTPPLEPPPLEPPEVKETSCQSQANRNHKSCDMRNFSM
eukprot:1971194-Amphidinium_carterae.1